MTEFDLEDLREHIGEAIAEATRCRSAARWYRRTGIDRSDGVIEHVRQDFVSAVVRDPASQYYRSPLMTFHSPFYATLLHRVAHWLWRGGGGGGASQADGKGWALALHHYARSKTGVDIHPGAAIGRRLVIDHGHGTVIGETAEIGEDAYILNGVVIGARGIADNAAVKRHPTVGDNVQIGAFAQLLGPIAVGDDVVIDPHSCVVRDVPSRSRVRVMRPGHVVDPVALPPAAMPRAPQPVAS